VSLTGAGLGVTAAHLLSTITQRDPGFLVIVVCAVVGAIASMYLQRYFIIVFTSFGGAMTLLDGVMASLGRSAAARKAAEDVWVFYPLNPAPGQRWFPYAWVLLGLLGVVVQLGWTGGEKGRVVRRRSKKRVET
jgi:hypothetical protein